MQADFGSYLSNKVRMLLTCLDGYNVTKSEHLQDWGYGNIGMTMVYQGSEWDSEEEKRGNNGEKVARM
jgi:hypothetical protein